MSLAAHEIRTPITVIKAQAQLAARFREQGKCTDEFLEKSLRVFVQESDRLSRLSNDLLDIARIDNESLDFKFSRFALDDVVHAIVATQAGQHRDHELVFEEPSAGPGAGAGSGYMVTADRERVEQVLLNLIFNAVRSSPRGGRVAISLSSSIDDVSVSVSDQGMGIAGDRLAKIFDRYYQNHQTGFGGPGGLGIVLYLSREIIRRMGGQIRAKSEGPGLGAEFTFTLARHLEAIQNGR